MPVPGMQQAQAPVESSVAELAAKANALQNAVKQFNDKPAGAFLSLLDGAYQAAKGIRDSDLSLPERKLRDKIINATQHLMKWVRDPKHRTTRMGALLPFVNEIKQNADVIAGAVLKSTPAPGEQKEIELHVQRAVDYLVQIAKRPFDKNVRDLFAKEIKTLRGYEGVDTAGMLTRKLNDVHSQKEIGDGEYYLARGLLLSGSPQPGKSVDLGRLENNIVEKIDAAAVHILSMSAKMARAKSFNEGLTSAADELDFIRSNREIANVVVRSIYGWKVDGGAREYKERFAELYGFQIATAPGEDANGRPLYLPIDEIRTLVSAYYTILEKEVQGKKNLFMTLRKEFEKSPAYDPRLLGMDLLAQNAFLLRAGPSMAGAGKYDANETKMLFDFLQNRSYTCQDEEILATAVPAVYKYYPDAANELLTTIAATSSRIAGAPVTIEQAETKQMKHVSAKNPEALRNYITEIPGRLDASTRRELQRLIGSMKTATAEEDLRIRTEAERVMANINSPTVRPQDLNLGHDFNLFNEIEKSAGRTSIYDLLQRRMTKVGMEMVPYLNAPNAKRWMMYNLADAIDELSRMPRPSYSPAFAYGQLGGKANLDYWNRTYRDLGGPEVSDRTTAVSGAGQMTGAQAGRVYVEGEYRGRRGATVEDETAARLLAEDISNGKNWQIDRASADWYQKTQVNRRLSSVLSAYAGDTNDMLTFYNCQKDLKSGAYTFETRTYVRSGDNWLRFFGERKTTSDPEMYYARFFNNNQDVRARVDAGKLTGFIVGSNVSFAGAPAGVAYLQNMSDNAAGAFWKDEKKTVFVKYFDVRDQKSGAFSWVSNELIASVSAGFQGRQQSGMLGAQISKNVYSEAAYARIANEAGEGTREGAEAMTVWKDRKGVRAFIAASALANDGLWFRTMYGESRAAGRINFNNDVVQASWYQGIAGLDRLQQIDDQLADLTRQEIVLRGMTGHEQVEQLVNVVTDMKKLIEERNALFGIRSEEQLATFKYLHSGAFVTEAAVAPGTRIGQVLFDAGNVRIGVTGATGEEKMLGVKTRVGLDDVVVLGEQYFFGGPQTGTKTTVTVDVPSAQTAVGAQFTQRKGGGKEATEGSGAVVTRTGPATDMGANEFYIALSKSKTKDTYDMQVVDGNTFKSLFGWDHVIRVERGRKVARYSAQGAWQRSNINYSQLNGAIMQGVQNVQLDKVGVTASRTLGGSERFGLGGGLDYIFGRGVTDTGTISIRDMQVKAFFYYNL